MENYELQIEDIKLIEELIKTTTSIETLYGKMYELEISQRKDSEEFKKIVDYLKIALDVENQMYKDCCLSYSKCVALVDYIFQEKLPSKYMDDVDSIMTQSYDHKVIKRILNVLIDKIISDCEGMKEMLPRDLLDLIEQLGIPNHEAMISQTIYSGVELQKAFEKDTINGFLALLQEEIEKEKNDYYRNSLIGSKYFTSFINKDVEEGLIKNNFEIPRTCYLNSRFVAELTQTDLELYFFLKNTYGVKESVRHILEVLEIKDEDYDNPQKAISSILRQCLIRAIFLLMSDDVISDVNYEFHEFIENKEYIKEHLKDHISEEAVIKCFKAVSNDRSKSYVLSLGDNI